MKKTAILLLTILSLTMLWACAANPAAEAGPSASPTSTPLLPGKPPAPTAAPTATPPAAPPRVILPEELLSEAEATQFVGCPVTLTACTEDNELGSATQHYVYDLPKDIDYYESTIYALFDITQNGLICAEELAAGHDAAWAYHTVKKLVEQEITPIPGLGKDAFHLNETSQVHFLYQDAYYVVIAFTNTKVQYSEPDDLALNKAIAAHVADALSLADVSLSD